MLNRPVNPYRDAEAAARRAVQETVDANPGRRLALLLLAVIVPMGAIAARFAYVHACLRSEFADQFNRTIERSEPIPTRDGRIIAAGGEVLAEDLEQFGLMVHYRWLEEPADPLW